MKLARHVEKQMREQSRAYVDAVLREYPELMPYDQEPEPDPYPLPNPEPVVAAQIDDAPVLPLAGIRLIAYRVSQETGYTLKELRGKARYAPLVRARWECFVRCRAEGYSMPEIGAFFRRDHTTVLHGLRQMGCAPTNPDWHRKYPGKAGAITIVGAAL